MTIAELYDVQWDADNKLEDMPIFGTRRTGVRRGRYEVKGTIKAYHLDSSARSIVQGLTQVVGSGAAGTSGPGYLSQVPFTRYQMLCINANWPGNAIIIPYLLFVNITLEKDTMHWASDKPTLEDITFRAEDIYGQ